MTTETFDSLVQRKLDGEKVTTADLNRVRQAADLAEIDRAVAEEQARRDKAAAQAEAMEGAITAAEQWGTDSERILAELTDDLQAAVDKAREALTEAHRPVGVADAAFRRAYRAAPGEWAMPSPLPSVNLTTTIRDRVQEFAESVRFAAACSGIL